jgi:integrase
VAVLNRKGGPWKGGYVSVGSRGRKTYVLERRVNGKRFHVSTRCHDERAALRHLDRFESNPLAYRPEGDEGGAPLHITSADLQRYITWSREVKGNTREHAREVNRYLTHWLADLGAADWRGLKLGQLHAVLDKRKTARAYRIASLKAFFTWLREVDGRVTTEQDTTQDLATIQAVPERQRHEKAVTKAVVEQLLGELVGNARDLLLVKASTGFHTSEIRRIISGELNAVLEELSEPAAQATGCVAVVRFIHKNGDKVAKRIETRQLLDALLRLRETGFSARRVNDAIKAACVRLKLEEFTAGVLRHSWGTWHLENGASIEAIAAGYDHKSKRTTERFYLKVGVPKASVPAVTFDVADPTVH